MCVFWSEINVSSKEIKIYLTLPNISEMWMCVNTKYIIFIWLWSIKSNCIIQNYYLYFFYLLLLLLLLLLLCYFTFTVWVLRRCRWWRWRSRSVFTGQIKSCTIIRLCQLHYNLFQWRFYSVTAHGWFDLLRQVQK